MIGEMEFLESYEIIKKCPKCGGKVIRHVRKEPQENWSGKWYIEYCSEPDCDYLETGFTSKGYKPKNARKIKVG